MARMENDTFEDYENGISQQSYSLSDQKQQEKENGRRIAMRAEC